MIPDIAICSRCGWDAYPYTKLPAGAKAVRAVERDFEFLSGWANDRWHYIGVCVTLEDADGREVGRDSLWGIEDCENPGHGYYWKTVAAEMVNSLLSAHQVETAERAYWEARDTVTA